MDGVVDELVDGAKEGKTVGTSLGLSLGSMLGAPELSVGTEEGNKDGIFDDGEIVGAVGAFVGFREGAIVGPDGL